MEGHTGVSRSGRARVPSRKLRESAGNSHAYRAGHAGTGSIAHRGKENDPNAIRGAVGTIIQDDQIFSAMDVDSSLGNDSNAKSDAQRAAVERRIKVLEQKRKREAAKAKADKRRAEERAEAKREGISFWRYQERQRERGRRKAAILLQKEAKEAGILKGIGIGMFNLPTRIKPQPEQYPGIILEDYLPKTRIKIKKEKATKGQKGAGRANNEPKDHKKKVVRHTGHEESKYKISKKDKHMERDEDKKKRKRLHDLTDRHLSKALSMLNILGNGGAVDTTDRSLKVASDIGIWNMFGGAPNWYVPLWVVDPNLPSIFPRGKVSEVFSDRSKITPLSDAKFRKRFAADIGFSRERFERWIARSKTTKVNAVDRQPAIRPAKELWRFEQSLKHGGDAEPYASQVESMEDNQCFAEMRVEASRQGNGQAYGQIGRSRTHKSAASIQAEAHRRQAILRERAFRNVVMIHRDREEEREYTAFAMDVDVDRPHSNPFEKRLVRSKGITLKPLTIGEGTTGITYKQYSMMKKEMTALQGNSHPSPAPASKPSRRTETGDLIRCICGGLENDDEYTGLWIQCGQCEAWQHNVCVGAPMDKNVAKNMDYFCEDCNAEGHEEYFQALEKGEEIWQMRIAMYEERLESIKKRKNKKVQKSELRRSGRVARLCSMVEKLDIDADA